MPRLKIDGYEIDVPPGTKVIEAAERLGIIVPRFCYHPGLGSVGACRMCAVKFVEGPVKGVEMSCMVNAEDGMVVSTRDEEAVGFRRQVIEWLMMNHPHDCPVCDEGGHCLLQDMTVSGGHGIRRFPGKKRTYHDQDLGTFIQHEMNRCIHCWRCRRFYQEFAGYRDLGAIQIGNRTYFGRFSDGHLESPFAGNLADICPTGVFTDKPSRYAGRRWDFQRSPSLCIHCSLACQVVASARYRALVRLEARLSHAVNGYFICDRGRYGFPYVNHPGRPRRAKIEQEEVRLDRAIQAAAEKISRIVDRDGPQSVAAVGSARSSLETQGILKRLCQLRGWHGPIYFAEASMRRKLKNAVSRLDASLAVSQREIEQADFILAVGVDPVNEAPMLALAMRQASRKGAPVGVIDPRPISLPFSFEHLPVALPEMDLCLSVLVKGAVGRSAAEDLGPDALRFYDSIPAGFARNPELKSRMDSLTRRMKQSHRPVMICGTDIVRETTPALAADQTLLLRQMQKQAGLFYVLPEANSFGTALLSPSNGSLMETIGAIENGTVTALVLVESDPYWSFPDGNRLEQALRRLDLLVILDYLPSKTARHARIFLPTQTVFEAGGSFVNQEGRIQFTRPVFGGGIPIKQIGAGGHPPRIFRSGMSGDDPKAAWQILTVLSEILSPGEELSLDCAWKAIIQENPGLSVLGNFGESLDGVRLIPNQSGEKSFSVDWARDLNKDNESDGGMELLLVDWTFGTEELSSYSPYIQGVEKAPVLTMHLADGDQCGLADGDTVILHLDGGPLKLNLSLAENMARGVLVLPRHRQLPWQKLRALPAGIPVDRIEKA
jgi:NADH-quinone oxidoreductase subunit G